MKNRTHISKYNICIKRPANKPVKPALAMAMAMALTLAVTLLFSCASPDNFQQNDSRRETEDFAAFSNSSGALQVTVLDTGKSDAAVIMTENHTVLIDTSTEKESKAVLDFLHSNGIGIIDYMIITHFDKDHVGGADRIVEALEVETILQPDYAVNTKPYRQYLSALAEAEINIPVISLTETFVFSLDGATFTVYPPKKDSYKKENNYSLIVSIIYGETGFLFMGDALDSRIEEFLDSCDDPTHDYIKVPHHGIYNDSNKKLFEMVQPQFAVITDTSNTVRISDTLAILDKEDVKIHLTSEGPVHAVSDGLEMHLYQ